MFESKLCFAIHRDHSTTHTVSDHLHKSYELVYYIKGNGTSVIDGQKYKYTDKCFCIIPQNHIHSEYSDIETELMYIGFEYDDSLGALPIALLNESNDPKIFSIMKKILFEVNTRNNNYNLMISLLLNELILEVLRITFSEKFEQRKSIDYLSYVKNYIKSNFSNSLDLQELAQTVGYSYHYLRISFKNEYGITLKQYILKVRIRKAKELLQQTKQSVGEIAQQCGFISSSRFIEIFKQIVGETPFTYRKNHVQYIEKVEYLNEKDK